LRRSIGWASDTSCASWGLASSREVRSGRVVLDVRYQALRGADRGLAVHRSALFGVLFDAVKGTHIAMETGVKVEAVDRASGRRPVLMASGGRRFDPFDLAIDALGSRSPLISQAAAPVCHKTSPMPPCGRHCRGSRTASMNGTRNSAMTRRLS